MLRSLALCSLLFTTTALCESVCTIGKQRFSLADKFGISSSEIQDDMGLFLTLYGIKYMNINFTIRELTLYNDRIIIHRIPVIGDKEIVFDGGGDTKIHCRKK